MLKDFKAFIMKGNVLDLAIAVIISHTKLAVAAPVSATNRKRGETTCYT